MKLRSALFCVWLAVLAVAAEHPPEIIRISPTAGPEGTRVEIAGQYLLPTTSVRFGSSPATFKVLSDEKLIAIVPCRTSSSVITVSTPAGLASSPFSFVVLTDPRIPEDVRYKAGYINSPAPEDFHSAMLWGIAIADTRVAGYENATVEVSRLRLSCRADGKEVILNDDAAKLRGGLYRRDPWFDGNWSEPMPASYDDSRTAVVLQVGKRADRIWHFWSGSPRRALPPGKLEGCTVTVRAKISAGALLQVGMDYWRDTTSEFGKGGNNHEAGVSNWNFPSDRWQEAIFTDIGGLQF